MTQILLLLSGTVLANDLLLARLADLSAPSAMDRTSTLLRIAAFSTPVLLLASVLAFLVQRHLLQPFDLLFLRPLCFIGISVAMTAAAFAILRRMRFFSSFPAGLLPLVFANGALPAAALATVERVDSLMAALIFSGILAIAFSLATVLFSLLRERLAVSDAPEPFRGNALAMITVGLMSLAFMGFAGMV